MRTSRGQCESCLPSFLSKYIHNTNENRYKVAAKYGSNWGKIFWFVASVGWKVAKEQIDDNPSTLVRQKIAISFSVATVA